MRGILLNVLIFSLIIIITSKPLKWRNRRQVPRCFSSCVLLKNCDPYLELLRNGHRTARKTIRESRCGREGYRIKVCCPKKPSIQESYFPYDCGNNPAAAHKIYTGQETLMGQYPWIAALEYKKPNKNITTVLCGGTVINARYVLTSAHCIDQKILKGSKLQTVRLGDWDLSTKTDCFEGQNGKDCAPPYVAAKPEKLIPHPSYYVDSFFANDIALIRLDRTIDFKKAKGYIQPICLPSFGIEAELLKRDRDPIVIGWGQTENRRASPILLQANVPFAKSRKECERWFQSDFGKKQLCIGRDRRDSCQGDSGGPLMLSGPGGPPYLQIGIVSFGKNCGDPSIPAVYTSVQHYKAWISRQLEPWN